MKRSLQLKQNKTPLIIKTSVLRPNNQKDSKLFLPPLQYNPNPESQKTLALLLLKMESFITEHPGIVSDILNKCLKTVNAHLTSNPVQNQPLAQSLIASIHRKTDPAIDEWGVRSQVLSVKRGDLQKVQSRKLFEKMRSAKYEEGPLRTDQEVIIALRSKINELEQANNAFNKKLEELRGQLQEKEKIITTYKASLTSTEESSKNLTTLNAELQSKLAQTQQILSNNKQKSKALIEEWQNKCRQKQQQLHGREQQLKALWQVYFSSNACLL